MAEAIRTLSIKLNFKDAVGTQAVIDKIKSSFKGLEQVIQGNTKPAIQKLRNEINTFASTGNQSISTIESQVTALKALRREADINSKEFKELTADISKYEKQLNKARGRRPGQGGRALAATQMAGAVVSGGIFGGPEGAVGALGGALLGGVPGAFAGAAIGAQVGQLREAAGASAAYAANLEKLRIALLGVTTSQEEYSESLNFIQQVTKDFAIPQEIITRQFTKLQASVQGAGGDVEDTKTAFKGIVAAVRATGGSLADVDSALTATAQVFSKGKVSAEELRQQIGERLPGAFTLFAKSIGLTPQELDEALQKGEVTLQDFQTFAKAIFDQYGENAKSIASSSASAGDQLKVTLEQLNEKVGELLAPVGAEFQKTFNDIAKSILGAVEALDKFFGVSSAERVDRLITQVNAINSTLARTRASIADRESEIKEKGDSLNTRRGQIDEDKRFIEELESRRDILRREINNLTRGQAVTVVQPTAGAGLGGGGGGGNDIAGAKDITKAVADAQIAELELRRKGIALTVEQIKQTANLKRLAAESLPPEKQRVELKKIELDEANQIFRLEEDTKKVIEAMMKDIVTGRKKEEELILRKDEALAEIHLITGDITKEQYEQLKITEEAKKLTELFPDLFKEVEEALQQAATPLGQFKKGLREIFEEAMNLKDALATQAVQAVQTLGDTFADFVATGKADFADMTKSILQDLSRIFAKAALFKGLSLIPGVGSFLGLGGGGGGGGGSTGLNLAGIEAYMNAKGNVYAKNKIVPFAYGGIVNKPTLFPMANGAGIMGEAGPEAIMPLRRGSNGKLGIEASGGVGNVVVNVDASGSRVQGDQPNAKALGSAIGAAVQAELVRQKRPGGLLS